MNNTDKLNRSELRNIIETELRGVSRDSINISLIKKCVAKLSEKLGKYECESDSRFVPYGRMEYLQEEFIQNLNNNSFIDAIFNISDFLNDSRIQSSYGENSPSIVDNNLEYFKEDIVCVEEQEILLNMIKEFIKKMIKIDILEDICNGINESIDNFNVDRLEEVNADVYTLKNNQKGLGGIIIGDDGTSLVCGSMYPLDYYIEEFKNGIRNGEQEIVENKQNDYITREEYNKMFETDENNAFIRLIIPANQPSSEYKEELNLIGKLPSDFTKDEVIRMKIYSHEMYEKIRD